MSPLRRYPLNVVKEAMKERDLAMDQALEELKGTGGQENVDAYDRISHGRLY